MHNTDSAHFIRSFTKSMEVLFKVSPKELELEPLINVKFMSLIYSGVNFR